MEMRALLARAGRMRAWWAVGGMCGKVRREVWVDFMVEPLGRPKRIP